jgi:hypothetical protein
VLQQAVTHNLYNFHNSIPSLHHSNRRVSISFYDAHIDTEDPEEHRAVSLLSPELRSPSHHQQSPISSHPRPFSCEFSSHCHRNIRSASNQLQILSCLSSYKSKRVRSWDMQLVLCFTREIWGGCIGRCLHLSVAGPALEKWLPYRIRSKW